MTTARAEGLAAARPMRTIQITLAYDGTAYVGWQRQARGVSIQGLVEAALLAIEGTPVRVVGAGRTDAGVHALAQEASFSLRHPIPLDALVRALNARLPPDIRVYRARERDAGFHARYAALAKAYRYTILNGPVADPFARGRAWHVAEPLDAVAMAEALAALRGTHDFAPFQASGGTARSTTRTIHEAVCRSTAWRADADLAPGAGPGGSRVVIDLAGDGFLRHMVRAIVGTLVQVGLGRRPTSHMQAILASQDRRLVGPTAPAHGLCLVRVDYPPIGGSLESVPAAP